MKRIHRFSSSLLETIKKENKIVFYCQTYYHIFLAVLIILSIKRKEKCCIVICPHRKPIDSIQNYLWIYKKLQQEGFICFLNDKLGIMLRLIGVSNIKNNIFFLKVKRVFLKKEKKYALVNFSWNRQVVMYPASIFFKHAETAYFVEEGATQYVTPMDNKFHVLMLKIYGNQVEWWKIDKLKKVYVQKPWKYDDYLRNKMEQFRIDELYKNLTEKDKNMIINTFLSDYEKQEVNKLMIIQEKIVIFTQPISTEDGGALSTKRKYEIYNDICSFYGQYGKVFLKIHPRDSGEYNIKGVEIIKGKYPSEIWKILGIEFKAAVGLCTGAIENVDAKKKCNLNEQFLYDNTYQLIEINEM